MFKLVFIAIVAAILAYVAFAVPVPADDIKRMQMAEKKQARFIEKLKVCLKNEDITKVDLSRTLPDGCAVKKQFENLRTKCGAKTLVTNLKSCKKFLRPKFPRGRGKNHAQAKNPTQVKATPPQAQPSNAVPAAQPVTPEKKA